MNRHVLVVEDEGLAALALEDLFTDEGYRVTLAGDGEKALTAFERDRPDAVVTDLNMPRMNGALLMRRLREIDASLPIVVLTGYRAVTPELKTIVDELPRLTPVLEKPVGLEKVSAAVRDVLATA